MAKILYLKPTLQTFHDFKFGNCSNGSAAAPRTGNRGQCIAGGGVNIGGYCGPGVCATNVMPGSGKACSIGYEADAGGDEDCNVGVCATDCYAGTNAGPTGTTCGAGNGARENY